MSSGKRRRDTQPTITKRLEKMACKKTKTPRRPREESGKEAFRSRIKKLNKRKNDSEKLCAKWILALGFSVSWSYFKENIATKTSKRKE